MGEAKIPKLHKVNLNLGGRDCDYKLDRLIGVHKFIIRKFQIYIRTSFLSAQKAGVTIKIGKEEVRDASEMYAHFLAHNMVDKQEHLALLDIAFNSARGLCRSGTTEVTLDILQLFYGKVRENNNVGTMAAVMDTNEQEKIVELLKEMKALSFSGTMKAVPPLSVLRRDLRIKDISAELLLKPVLLLCAENKVKVTFKGSVIANVPDFEKEAKKAAVILKPKYLMMIATALDLVGRSAQGNPNSAYEIDLWSFTPRGLMAENVSEEYLSEFLETDDTMKILRFLHEKGLIGISNC